jgi:N-acetylglucosamine kinase-like BadF-type ATPase
VILLGIDAGGSHTDAVATDEALVVLGRAQGAPGWAGDPAAAANIRATALDALDGRTADRVVIGAAGAGDRTRARALREALADLAPDVQVTTDVAIALTAAFGDGPGIVVLAGTGSVAAARLADGDTAQAGGLGPASGDPGSGYALGHAALGAGLVTGFGTDRAAIASLAEPVCRLALGGNALAARLVDETARDLAALVFSLAAKFQERATVACGGGLLRAGSPVRAALFRRLRNTVAVDERAFDCALAAARMAAASG